MSFNAGGANVGGVQSLEQGVLKAYSLPTTFSNAGGEQVTIDHVCPTGKKWIIKNIGTQTNTFVGTISLTFASLVLSGGTVTLSTASGSSNLSYNLPVNLTLSAGDIIRIKTTSSAWTSGQQSDLVIVQEVTI